MPQAALSAGNFRFVHLPAVPFPTEEGGMHAITSVTLDDAQRVIEAGIAKAKEINSPSNIAVADAGGNLLAFARMDDAWLGSIDIAINKAFTSRAFNIATQQLAGFAQPREQFYGIHVSNHGRVMIFAGGLPLKSGNSVVGAVGVSGGTGAQDQEIVEAAAAAL
ncbi:MAG: cobalamin adenosyltransferase [Rhodospirillales bacterium]|nr:cobalamin adenosyltransferase [Rhodospirillales bacterium]